MSTTPTLLLVYDAAALDGDEAARDVLTQLDAVENAVAGKYTPVRFGASLNLDDLRRTVTSLRPAVVFNLAESLAGADRLQTMVPLALEEWGVPFTGCGSRPMLLANHKVAAKRTLGRAGLPTAACAWLEAGRLCGFPERFTDRLARRWIVKASEAHASVHLDDTAVFVPGSPAALETRLATTAREWGLTVFAEEFVDGREFNMSAWAGDDGRPAVLPAAEIEFVGFPADRPRIVGYAAKWHEDSSEYLGTRRRFTDAADAALAARLADLSERVWLEMGLDGYARVDYRVDAAGEPIILEVNANPCLSPDAGFAAAAERAGFGYAAMVERVIAAALGK